VLAAEKALGLLERPSPIPALTLAIVLECGAVAISDAQRALGLTPRPWRETVQSSVDWVRSDAYRAALGGDPAAASVDVGVR
jgi:hypothetical protein